MSREVCYRAPPRFFLRFGHLLLLKGPGAVVEKSHRPSCGRPSPWRCVTRACNLQDAKKPGSAWLGGTIRLTLPCLPQPAGREFPRERIARSLTRSRTFSLLDLSPRSLWSSTCSASTWSRNSTSFWHSSSDCSSFFRSENFFPISAGGHAEIKEN